MSRPFEILFTSYDYRPRLGGVATCVFELAKALAAEPDVKVTLIAPTMPGDAEFDGHGRFRTVRVASPRTALSSLPLAVARLSRILLKERPDAILSGLWLPGGTTAWLASPLRASLGVPYFMIAHGVEVMESRRTFRKRVRSALTPFKRRIFGSAAAVFAVSRYTAGLVERECGVGADRVVVTNNGVDAREFTPGPKPADLVARHGLEGRTVFLTVTRLESYKGVDFAIRALARVAREHARATLVVCGEGGDRGRLEALARELGVAERVLFVGKVPPGRLTDFYRLCDCFVLLSREDRVAPNVEGFGLVFLEAAACAKPSIAGHSGGIVDAVEDGVSGWLVDPESVDEVAAAMARVCSSPAEAARVGAQGRERAVASFTWGHMARKILAEMRARAGR